MSPKSPEQFEAIRQRSRATIMQAALELFGNNGYHNTTISQIAKEAGVSKGLLYNYFKGKEDLLECIVMEAFKTGDELMDESIHWSEDPREQLAHMVELALKTVKANVHYWKLMFSLALQKDAIDIVSNLVKQKNQQSFEIGVDLFKRMGVADPVREAWLFGALERLYSLH